LLPFSLVFHQRLEPLTVGPGGVEALSRNAHVAAIVHAMIGTEHKQR